MSDSGRLPVGVTVRLGAQIARGLAALHADFGAAETAPGVGGIMGDGRRITNQRILDRWTASISVPSTAPGAREILEERAKQVEAVLKDLNLRVPDVPEAGCNMHLRQLPENPGVVVSEGDDGHYKQRHVQYLVQREHPYFSAGMATEV